MRETLATVGTFLSSKVVDFVMGIITSLIFLPKIVSLDDYTSITVQSLVFVVLIGAGVALLSQIIGVQFLRWSKTYPVNVEFKKTSRLLHLDEWNEAHTELTSRDFSALKIINNEHSELEECYAVITIDNPSSDLYVQRIWGQGENKLTWRNGVGSPCKTSIGAHGGEQILLVYEVALKSVLSTNSHTLSFTDFCICDQTKQVVQLSHSALRYDFSIVIHAKLNGAHVEVKKEILFRRSNFCKPHVNKAGRKEF